MVKMQKILGILLALCFLLSVTAGAASACSCNNGHGKEKCGHHADFGKWNKDRHAKFVEFKQVKIHCFDSNCKCNEEDDNSYCSDEDEDNNEDEC
jgi:hypothetical protein